jgi:hypothetical protein
MPQFYEPVKSHVKKEKAKNPWDFRAPAYDERTSCYMSAGAHHGVGFTNPVGHEGATKQLVPALPYGHKLGMTSDEAPRKMLNPDMEQ